MPTTTLSGIRFQHLYKTENEWNTSNPILLSGEIAHSSDRIGMFKIGNGTAKWTALPYNQAFTLYGLTASINELNYVKGVTGNIQTQINGKSPTSHTHNYATKLTLSGIEYNVSSNAITITRDNLLNALGAVTTSVNGYMLKDDKAKLDKINVSDIGKIGTGSIVGTGYISASISSGVATITHKNSGVAAGSYGADSTNYFRIPKFTVDTTGHITAASYYDLTAANLVARIGTTAVSNATSATLIQGTYTSNGGKQPPSYIPNGKVRFNMMNTPINGDNGYKDFILMDTYTGNDVPYVTALAVSKSNIPRAYVMVGAKKGSEWSTSAELLSTNNYNTYVPTKTGGGASGTWGININGNSKTATTLASSRNFSIVGGAIASAVGFNGAGNVELNVTSLNAVKLALSASDTLVLDGTF